MVEVDAALLFEAVAFCIEAALLTYMYTECTYNLLSLAMELLSHITKRLQTRSQVQLPIIVLIEQLDGATPIVQNFILVYLRIGIPRLSPVNQIEMLPLLIKSMNDKTKKQIDSILLLYSGALIHLTITDAAALKSLVPPDGTMKEYYLCYQLTLLLIPYR
uniref:Proteasome component Ecm29 N-terminal domain-containing protein n=1 Tax=Amphimedon queenslandica TaxID=400682 RepID=A0A1X7V1N6_AMPQE